MSCSAWVRQGGLIGWSPEIRLICSHSIATASRALSQPPHLPSGCDERGRGRRCGHFANAVTGKKERERAVRETFDRKRRAGHHPARRRWQQRGGVRLHTRQTRRRAVVGETVSGSEGAGGR